MTDEFGRISGARAGFQAPSPLTAMPTIRVALPPVCGAGRSAWQSSQRCARCETSGLCVSQHGRVLVCAEIGERAVESRLASLSSLLNELIQACAVKHVGTDGEHQALHHPRCFRQSKYLPAYFAFSSSLWL